MNREEALMNGENMEKFEASSRMDTFNNGQGRVVGAAFAESRDYTGAAKMCDLWSTTGMLKTLVQTGVKRTVEAELGVKCDRN